MSVLTFEWDGPVPEAQSGEVLQELEDSDSVHQTTASVVSFVELDIEGNNYIIANAQCYYVQ